MQIELKTKGKGGKQNTERVRKKESSSSEGITGFYRQGPSSQLHDHDPMCPDLDDKYRPNRYSERLSSYWAVALNMRCIFLFVIEYLNMGYGQRLYPRNSPVAKDIHGISSSQHRCISWRAFCTFWHLVTADHDVGG